jgi:osmotically-inducible protein OsmY
MLIVGCATFAPKSAEQAQSDEITAQRVYAALNADPTYYFRHVDVRVDRGVAYLGGYIWSTQAIYRARRIAAAVPGVDHVVNAMELERQGTRGRSGSG